MNRTTRTGILVLPALLALGGTARAEQSGQSVGGPYYYYPQPAFYQPYAPYGAYQPPVQAMPRPAAPAPQTAKEPAQVPASSKVATIDPDRYPVAERAAVEGDPGGLFAIREGRLGPVLAGADGRTLYVEFGDTPESSGCNADCSGLWQPYLADPDQEPVEGFTLVRTRDGSLQWGYAGRPLYQWAGDREAGEVTGDGIGGTWLAVRIRRG